MHEQIVQVSFVIFIYIVQFADAVIGGNYRRFERLALRVNIYILKSTVASAKCTISFR